MLLFSYLLSNCREPFITKDIYCLAPDAGNESSKQPPKHAFNSDLWSCVPFSYLGGDLGTSPNLLAVNHPSWAGHGGVCGEGKLVIQMSHCHVFQGNESLPTTGSGPKRRDEHCSNTYLSIFPKCNLLPAWSFNTSSGYMGTWHAVWMSILLIGLFMYETTLSGGGQGNAHIMPKWLGQGD